MSDEGPATRRCPTCGADYKPLCHCEAEELAAMEATWDMPKEQPVESSVLEALQDAECFMHNCILHLGDTDAVEPHYKVTKAIEAMKSPKRESSNHSMKPSGWQKYPGAVPKLYEGMNLSYPLLFHVKIPGADYVYQGYYNAENNCFYEAGHKEREFKEDVAGFMHYPLPEINDIEDVKPL